MDIPVTPAGNEAAIGEPSFPTNLDGNAEPKSAAIPITQSRDVWMRLEVE
jgi:hypothetical protein